MQDDVERLGLLREMYAGWSFFRISLENASVALAQANMPVFRWYAELGADIDGSEELTQAIFDEHERSRTAVLKILQVDRLLEKTPWLERSIEVRNGYVDPLNLLQCELLRRAATGAGTTTVEIEHLIHLTIKGVSTGMRTTG